MDLKILPEPLPVKGSIRKGLEVHRELEIANLKQGAWIASKLWSEMGWGRELKKHGLTWQKFMVIVRDHYPYFYDWVVDRMSWEEVMRKLLERIQDEISAINKD